MHNDFGMRQDVSYSEKRKTDVAVVIKTFDLLEVIAEEGRAGLTALAERTKITKASANRILSTLVGTEYLIKNPVDKSYSSGQRLVALSCMFSTGSRLVTLSRPTLEKIHQEFDETVNLGILNEASVLYLDMIESRRELRMAAHIGKRDPLHSTALGKAILSVQGEEEARRLLEMSIRTTPLRAGLDIDALTRDLERTRSRGYALDDEENEPGARCVAAPVIDAGGGCTVALSVSAPITRLDDAMIGRVGAALMGAAREIEKQLGYR